MHFQISGKNKKIYPKKGKKLHHSVPTVEGSSTPPLPLQGRREERDRVVKFLREYFDSQL